MKAGEAFHRRPRLTAPAPAPRVECRWKQKNSTATGIADSGASAGFSGYCVPGPGPPATKPAGPVVSLSAVGQTHVETAAPLSVGS
ncbi:hypothetical protein ACGRHY_25825 [Streptomyces sp. HK10]|uniref:hypothetical protein n=1 Tax=Streptomyces sp. HK10 TaxID=3373255 RepID=UPI003749041F